MCKIDGFSFSFYSTKILIIRFNQLKHVQFPIMDSLKNMNFLQMININFLLRIDPSIVIIDSIRSSQIKTAIIDRLIRKMHFLFF